ncbi:hypothetical protein SDC9_199396 [bioreactor metagenome]|uniref:Uncharacterized protein n=1 Tax=bioreactor metagenome TaxID=1076179 RepID=A0A645IKF3_9ZZZZ
MITNVKLKSWYNPGLGAVLFLHCPIGVYYIWYVASNGLASTMDYVFGFVATVLAAFIMVALPILILRDKQSKYPFAESEVYRFGKEKLTTMLKK